MLTSSSKGLLLRLGSELLRSSGLISDGLISEAPVVVLPGGLPWPEPRVRGPELKDLHRRSRHLRFKSAVRGRVKRWGEVLEEELEEAYRR